MGVYIFSESACFSCAYEFPAGTPASSNSSKTYILGSLVTLNWLCEMDRMHRIKHCMNVFSKNAVCRLKQISCKNRKALYKLSLYDLGIHDVRKKDCIFNLN